MFQFLISGAIKVHICLIANEYHMRIRRTAVSRLEYRYP